jgi:hypothetical protein
MLNVGTTPRFDPLINVDGHLRIFATHPMDKLKVAFPECESGIVLEDCPVFSYIFKIRGNFP